MKAMINGKAVEPDDVPVELLKVELRQDLTVSMELHRRITRKKYHISGKTRSLPFSARRTTRPNAETTVAGRSCPARVGSSLKWLPRDLAITVVNYSRESSAGFDRIARPRAWCLWCADCKKLGGRQECVTLHELH